MDEPLFGKRKGGPAPAAAKETISRRQARKRTLLTGKLVLGGGTFSADCIIVDLSDSGARVRIEPGADVGGDVVLIHLRDQIAFEAQVKWRRARDLGLEFIRTHDLRQATTPEMKRLRRYCLDYRPTTIVTSSASGRFRS